MSFRLTYATMFDPPEAMHERFDAALATVRSRLGGRHDLFLNGADVAAAHYLRAGQPIDSDLHLGEFAIAGPDDANAAMQAAHGGLSRLARDCRSPSARELLRRVADIMEQRVYEIAAALALEVGKNRMEALGEAQETVDFFRHYADDFERHAGYEHELPERSAAGHRLAQSQRDAAVRRVGGHRAVQFSAGARRRACSRRGLVTGNTVVVKGASDTPWAGRLLADCIRDAGLPPGVFNYLSGSGREVGAALASHPATAGITFTGSVAVGTQLLRQMAVGRVAAPVHRRNGRQESLHRHGARQSRRSGRGHRALGLWHGRPEVLGAVAAVCGSPRRGRADRAAAATRSPRSASAIPAGARTGSGR